MPVRQNHPATEFSTTGTVAIQLRSTVLREIWGLAAQTPVDADNAANDRPSVEQVENAIEVCAHGLSDLLATPGIEAERCRRGWAARGVRAPRASWMSHCSVTASLRLTPLRGA